MTRRQLLDSLVVFALFLGALVCIALLVSPAQGQTPPPWGRDRIQQVSLGGVAWQNWRQ